MSYDPGRAAQRPTSQLSILLITLSLMVLALQDTCVASYEPMLLNALVLRRGRIHHHPEQ